MPILRVALDLPLPQLFDYRLDEASSDDIGRCARVPFGSGKKIGVIIEVTESSDQAENKIKTAESILRDIPPLPSDWQALCEFCARYYQYPLGQVIHFALPPMLRRGKLPKRPNPTLLSGASPTRPPLLPDQAAAVDAIVAASNEFFPLLLHGVTGSGKTEVYLRSIEALLTQGGQALMLVPEIALTPQLEGRVRARFPTAHIVCAHSGMTEAARARAFLDALEDRVDIVLGTRLAVFMPLPRLGLIVVDEEQDTSFKQQDGLRYSARDVAVFRAKQRKVPIVLGSATPALETFHHAQTGRYQLLELPQRAVAQTMPSVSTVDTRREKLQDGLSAALIRALGERLERGEQSLVFLNRRGYAPVLACPACGWVSRCHRCAANLVLHLADKRLRCHHCGLEVGIPVACPDCGNQDLRPCGRGTQRLEVALTERFPQARLLRIDRDSASTPQKWEALLDTIHRGEADMLVGTQMLAKGHDFPKLTLVGVVGADAALFAADFRAPERLFAQLMQVGGRSGRAHLPGEVLIQTEYPDHPLYRALIAHDYSRFAHEQLAERKQAGFSPFVFHALLRAEAKAMEHSLEFLRLARTEARAMGKTAITLFDPVPMRLHRLMNLERAQLLVESHSRPALQDFLTRWSEAIRTLKPPHAHQLRWHLDVDPLEF